MRSEAVSLVNREPKKVVGQAYGGQSMFAKHGCPRGARQSPVCATPEPQGGRPQARPVGGGVVHTGEARRGCPAVLLPVTTGRVFTGEKLAFSRGEPAYLLRLGAVLGLGATRKRQRTKSLAV